MILLWEHNPVLSVLDLPFTKNIDEAKAVIVWNDIYPTEQAIINLARRKGIKTYVMQHGRRGSSQHFPPFDKEIYADKMLLWGEADKQALIEAGHPAKKLHVVGSPIISLLKSKIEHEEINIVFSPEHWDRPLAENIKVRDELRKLKGINIITKLINSPSHQEEYDNPVKTNVKDIDHLQKCIEVLQKADLVVGISESTFELLAQAMDIPVVIMEEWEPKSFGGDNTIGLELAYPDRLKEERRQILIDEGGLGIDTTNEIRKLLT
jgi:hypothetical protein